MRSLRPFVLTLLASCASVPAGLSAGDRLVEKDRCEDAIEAYGQALAEDPELVDAYLGRARCFKKLDRLDEAAEAFGEALAREQSERTLVPLAQVRTAQGQFDRADALIVQLVALAEDRRDRVRYQRQLAELRITAGNTAEAVVVLRKILIEDPEDNDARVMLGRALIETQQHDEAIRVLNEAFAIARESETLTAPLVCEVGRAMEAIERYADALRSYRYCEDLDRNHPPAMLGVGRILRKRKKLEESIEILEEVVQLWPDKPAPHYELGLALRDYGVYDRAVSELEIASTLDPAFADTYVPLLSLLADEVRDPVKRYAVLGRAAGTLDDNLEIQLEYGRSAARRRDHPEALAALEKAIAIAPSNAEANFYLGVVQAALGELEAATQTVEALGVLNPEQALELSEIVSETRKGRDPVDFLGGENGKSALGQNVKGRLEKREATKKRRANRKKNRRAKKKKKKNRRN